MLQLMDKKIFSIFHSTFLFKPQLHCHDFGHNGATTHPDLSSRDAWQGYDEFKPFKLVGVNRVGLWAWPKS